MSKPLTIDDLSIWTEANRDVSPAIWEEKIWPEIKQQLSQLIAEIVGEDEVIPTIPADGDIRYSDEYLKAINQTKYGMRQRAKERGIDL